MKTEHHAAPWKLLRSLLYLERKEIAVVMIYGTGSGLLALAIPVGVQALVNTVTFGAFNQPVVFLVGAVFLGLMVSSALRALQISIVEQLQKRFFAQIALELSYRIPRFQLHREDKGRHPELINRFFDVLTVQKSTATLLLEGFALALQILFGLMLLSFYHWFLLSFAIVLVLSIVTVLFVLGRGAIATSVEESVQKYQVAAWLEDMALRPLLFRTQKGRMEAITKTDNIVNDYLSARGKHFSILMRQIVGSLAIQAIGSSLLLGIGAYLVTQNQLTIGQLVAAEIVVTTALSSLAKFQKHLEAFYDLIAAIGKIDSLLSIPLERSSGESLPFSTQGPASLELRGVHFSYGSHPTIFNNLCMKLEAGAKITVWGENASGKSTLVDLVYGLINPQSGTLLFNGTDYREISLEMLREQVTLVRGLDIFPGTILENLSFACPKANTQNVKEALKSVGLLDDILKLPQGIQTRISADGSPLSVAQAQALVIARAMVKQPSLLIIDEVLDGLDSQAQSLAITALCDPKAPWTLILSTHNESIASRFNDVFTVSKSQERRSA